MMGQREAICTGSDTVSLQLDIYESSLLDEDGLELRIFEHLSSTNEPLRYTLVLG